jgi:hypothetical protein
VLLAMVRWLQLGDCNAVGSKPAGKRARCKDQLQRQKKGGGLVRSFLPAAQRPGLNRGARKVGLNSVATGRRASVGEEGGAVAVKPEAERAFGAEERSGVILGLSSAGSSRSSRWRRS